MVMPSQCHPHLCLEREESEPVLHVWVLAPCMSSCNSKEQDRNLFGPLYLLPKHRGKSKELRSRTGGSLKLGTVNYGVQAMCGPLPVSGNRVLLESSRIPLLLPSAYGYLFTILAEHSQKRP